MLDCAPPELPPLLASVPPELPPDCEPPGVEALEDEEPPLDELDPGWEGMPEGSDELEPDRPPLDGEGMLGAGALRPDPPELPDEPPPDDPPDDPLDDDGDEGDGMELDDWLAQPPINNAETALMLVT